MSIQEEYIGQNEKLPGKSVSLWLDTTPETNYPTLQEEIEADVVIVGGGLVGLLTAFILVHAKMNVVVLEGRKIAADVTGHTTAKITSQHGLIYTDISKRFGMEAAKTYGKSQETAIRFYEAVINENKIKCGFEPKDAFLYTQDYDLRKKILKEVDICERIGLPVEYKKETDLPFEIAGAEKFSNQGQFHPREFLIEIAKLVTKMGGRIYENSRALKIEDGDICEVQTESGRVFAKKMVIASHFPAYDTGGYFSKMVPIRSYVLAAKIEGNVPDGMYYGVGKGENYFSLRSQRVGIDRLVLFGGERHVAGRVEKENTVKKYKNLEKKVNKYFQVKEFSYHWSTQDNFTIDRIPYIGLSPNTKNTYLATGFGGWGMTNSAVSAILLSNLILGKDDKSAKTFDPKRLKPQFALDLAKNNIRAALHLVTDRFKTEDFEMLSELREGEGTIVSYKNKKLAVYKDKEGKLHQYTNKCTHMGCGMHWNGAEKTWDCHCHGSRFAPNGVVIHGPARTPLKEENPS